jgi:hypothetical protein
LLEKKDDISPEVYLVGAVFFSSTQYLTFTRNTGLLDSEQNPLPTLTTCMLSLKTCITQREFINDESSLNWDIDFVQYDDKLTS